ncbi:MAG: hypothetical protein ABL860_09700 [Candidatus Nitrotoga sp.]
MTTSVTSAPVVPAPVAVNSAYFNIDHNRELVLKFFTSYYKMHINSGKLMDEVPQFFLVKPDVLGDTSFVTRSSDKLIMNDCLVHTQERNGYVGVIKHRNPKLQYCWLEFIQMPFMLGDPVSENNKAQFFYLLSQFVEYSQLNPQMYGDLMAEIDSDKDLSLMIMDILKIGEEINPLLQTYKIEQLVAINPDWPPHEVKKMLESLKGSDMKWCEVFYECITYVMGRKAIF